MNYPQRINQVSQAKLDKKPDPPATAANGVTHPAPATVIGQFVRW